MDNTLGKYYPDIIKSNLVRGMISSTNSSSSYSYLKLYVFNKIITNKWFQYYTEGTGRILVVSSRYTLN